MTNTGCTTTTFIDTHFTPCYSGGAGTSSITRPAINSSSNMNGRTRRRTAAATTATSGERISSNGLIEERRPVPPSFLPRLELLLQGLPVVLIQPSLIER